MEGVRTMLSVEALREYGADTDQGLGRCMNNEAFYLRMVEMTLADPRFAQLRGVVESGNLEQAFELCHALKGVVGNLALEPLFQPLSELTELLRSRTRMDYSALLTRIGERWEELARLAEQSSAMR